MLPNPKIKRTVVLCRRDQEESIPTIYGDLQDIPSKYLPPVRRKPFSSMVQRYNKKRN